MQTARRRYLALSHPLLAPDGDTPPGGGGANPPADPPATPPADPTPDPRELVKNDEALQEFVNGLLAAERKKTEDRLKAEADKRLADEAAKREQEEAIKRGEFDKVRADLEGRVSTYETDLEATKAQLESYRELVAKDVEASWASIPEEVRETYAGDEDDVLAKKQHIQRNAKIIERLTAPTTRRPGNGPDPKPGPVGTEEAASPVTRRQILS